MTAQTQPFVFSIQPKYVKRILEGSKAWEFRTRRPTLVAHEMILIYSTSPISRIVATAEVNLILDASPDEVWLTALRRGVTYSEFHEYYKGRDRAVALHLANVVKLPEPRPLPEGMAPPQSWSRYKGVWT